MPPSLNNPVTNNHLDHKARIILCLEYLLRLQGALCVIVHKPHANKVRADKIANEIFHLLFLTACDQLTYKAPGNDSPNPGLD